MRKFHPLILFTGFLTMVLAITFFMHLAYLQSTQPIYDVFNLISPYLVNWVLALSITFLLYALRIKQAENLGYIFMLSSLVKFAIFFFWFYPLYKSDGDVTKVEFAQFFIPYIISLTTETVFLINILNKMD